MSLRISLLESRRVITSFSSAMAISPIGFGKKQMSHFKITPLGEGFLFPFHIIRKIIFLLEFSDISVALWGGKFNN